MTTETSPPGVRSRAALAGTHFADVRWAATTGSTNSDAMDLARQGAPEGIVLVADHQSTGRGRLGRSWQAPAGSSLLVSVLLRPTADLADAVVMVVGLAMASAVEEVAGVEPRLKWPNDLVVAVGGADRKLAGILAEADWPDGSSGPAVVVVGIGANVNWPEAIPAELSGILAACNHLVGHDVDRESLLIAFLRRLDAGYERLRRAPADREWLRAEWRACSATLGRQVLIDLGANQLEGTAVDIDEGGRLVVETIDGARTVVAAGDVVHLRTSEFPAS